MDWTRIILDLLDRTPFLPNLSVVLISQVIWDLQCSEDGFQALPILFFLNESVIHPPRTTEAWVQENIPLKLFIKDSTWGQSNIDISNKSLRPPVNQKCTKYFFFCISGFFCVVLKIIFCEGKKNFKLNIVEICLHQEVWPGSHEIWSCSCPSLWWIGALLCGTGLGSEVRMGGTGHHALPGAGTAGKAGPNFTKMSLVPTWRSVLRHPAGLPIILPNKRGHPVLEKWGWSHVAWKQCCVSQENKKEVQQFLCQTLEVINIRTNISLISCISHGTAGRKAI